MVGFAVVAGWLAWHRTSKLSTYLQRGTCLECTVGGGMGLELLTLSVQIGEQGPLHP